MSSAIRCINPLFIVLVSYKHGVLLTDNRSEILELLRYASSRKSFNQGVYVFDRVVKMGRDTQARPARGDDDVALFQMCVERHGRPSVFGLKADDLRLLSCPPRADDLVTKAAQPLAQIVC